jgi:Asp-tRNA(Asn)/Glu-tRNA(Gln) amidotransferase A subunit family amidase
MDILALTAQEIARLVAHKELSAREVLEANLSHIQRVDGVSGSIGGDRLAEPDKVHAFINLTTERARKQADEVDRKIAKGEPEGMLAGVPVTVKDIFCVMTTSTAASKFWRISSPTRRPRSKNGVAGRSF